jgi:gliding motility-associated-like protein
MTMKKLILFLAIFISVSAQAQTYLISDGGTVTNCVGDFFDSGGSGGGYAANENFTITFHSNNGVQTHTRMAINSFDVDASDMLYVYDGPTTASPLIGVYNNSNNPVSTAFQASINNVSGDLTFQFISNGVTEGQGWFASLSCVKACQKVYSALDSLVFSPTPDDSGYVNICLGDTITFAALGTGPGVFPEDGSHYDQDAATSLFIWDFGDGVVDTGQVINHAYSIVHGYDVILSVVDTIGCTNTNFLFLRVRISGNPIGSVNPLPNICSKEDTIEITVGYGIDNVIQVVPVVSTQGATQSFDSTMFIPDGPQCGVNCYSTNVTFTAFPPGATITSASDILSICVNMEHSFAGDLGFTIYCPNGQSTILDPNTHSGGAYLGNPMGGASHENWDAGGANELSCLDECDPLCNPTSNDGWNYCWSEIYAQQGTLGVLDGGTSPIDSTNQQNHTNYITPENPLSSLIGCPLNGLWNIEICDDYGIDNGYIFNWTLELDPSLLQSTSWSYNVPIDSFAWGGNYIVGTTDSSIFVYPNTGGIYNYSLTIYDAFGCTYDTSLAITVVTSPYVDLGNDTSVCAGNVLSLDAGNPGSVFSWSTGGITQNIFVSATGSYSVTVTNTDGASLFCTDIDTINVTYYPMPVVDLGPDICSESVTGVTLDAYPGPGTFSYFWNSGETTQTISANSSGLYYVNVQSGTGSPCYDNDTIGVNIIPHPVVDLGPDTIICSQYSVELFANQLPDSPEYTYLWSPSGSTGSSITFNPGTLGPHQIVVVKTGCTAETDTIEITGMLCEVTVPNVFTPTNSDGYNDFFVIEGLEYYPNTRVLIFNRWGNKVYESSNYQNDWDGGGQSDGVYYYVITFPQYINPKTNNVEDYSMTGTVTIFSK